MSSKFTHFDDTGQAHMVDVGGKEVSRREACATGFIQMQPQTLNMIKQGGHKKGDVLAIARIAGIMATKRTADLVPLCHPLSLTHVAVEFDIDDDHHRVICEVTTRCSGQTGVEMEALSGVQVALLTIYDMCKAVDRGMLIGGIHLLRKSGGKSGEWRFGDG